MACVTPAGQALVEAEQQAVGEDSPPAVALPVVGAGAREVAEGAAVVVPARSLRAAPVLDSVGNRGVPGLWGLARRVRSTPLGPHI